MCFSCIFQWMNNNSSLLFHLFEFNITNNKKKYFMVLIKKLVERNESEQLTVDLWSYKVDLYLTIRCMFRIEYNFEIFVHFHGVVPFLKKRIKLWSIADQCIKVHLIGCYAFTLGNTSNFEYIIILILIF